MEQCFGGGGIVPPVVEMVISGFVQLNKVQPVAPPGKPQGVGDINPFGLQPANNHLGEKVVANRGDEPGAKSKPRTVEECVGRVASKGCAELVILLVFLPP